MSNSSRLSPLPRFPLLLLTALSLGACYGAAPPKPAPVPLPAPNPSAQLTVDSKATTRFENVAKESHSCPQGVAEGHPSCIKTTYTVKEPVTRTVSTVSYGSVPIDYAQFLVLADPNYQDKLDLLADHSEACKEANLPRYIGLGLSIGGAVAYAMSGGKPAVKALSLVGLGGGIASYTTGYFAFGGNRCSKAKRLYGQVNHAPHREVCEIRGSRTADEMQALAESFNKRILNRRASRGAGQPLSAP